MVSRHRVWSMGMVMLTGALVLARVTFGIGADKPTKPAEKSVPAKAKVGKALPKFTPEREAAALIFVQQQHPELARILANLKTMQPEGYQQAIREIFQVSETVSEADPERREHLLESWKIKSRLELAVAKIKQSKTEAPALDQEVRQLVERQVDLELANRADELARAKDRYEKAERDYQRLLADRDKNIDARHRRLTVRPKTAKTAPTKTETASE